MFPPVSFDSSLVNLSIPVSVAPGSCPDTIGVKTRKFRNVVPPILLVDSGIQPINFLSLIVISRVGDRPIVGKPCQLRSVHKGGDGDGVLHLVDLGIEDHGSKFLELVHNVLPVIIPNEVVIPCHDAHIHWPTMHSIQILDPKSITEGVDTSTFNGKIVAVKKIPSMLADVSIWGSKVHVECAVRNDQLGPGLWVGDMARHA